MKSITEKIKKQKEKTLREFRNTSGKIKKEMAQNEDGIKDGSEKTG